MAETKSDENVTVDPSSAEPKSRRGVLLGGGVTGLVAAAWIVSLVALPKKPDVRSFRGPFVTPLTIDDVQVNLKGDSAKRYMVMQLQAEYDAYDEEYAAARIPDPLYQAKLRDVLIGLGRRKSKDDIDDRVGEETFKEELRDVVGPLVFPLHVGNAEDYRQGHEASGLRPGDSVERSTLRGGFHEHVLQVDGPRRTVSLDDGPAVTFEGTETDLRVEDARGRTLYVDVSRLDQDFAGEVPVGTFGRVREVLFGKFLVQ